jgi:hypothetical protein
MGFCKSFNFICTTLRHVIKINSRLPLALITVYSRANSCPFHFDFYDYIKYGFICIISINVLYYAAKIMISNFNKEQIPITLEQKKLLGISDTGIIVHSKKCGLS